MDDISRFDASILITLALSVLKNIDAHFSQVSYEVMIILLLLYVLGIILLLLLIAKLVGHGIETNPRLVSGVRGVLSCSRGLLGKYANFSIVKHLYTVVPLRLPIFVIVRHPINFNLESC